MEDINGNRYLFKNINPWPPIAAAFVAQRLGFTTPEIEAVKPWWDSGHRILANGKVEESRGTLEEWVWAISSLKQLSYHQDPEICRHFLTFIDTPLSYSKARKDWRLLKYLVADPDENSGNFLVKYTNGEVEDWVAIDMEKAFSYNHHLPAYSFWSTGTPFRLIQVAASEVDNPWNDPQYNIRTYQWLKVFYGDKDSITKYLSGYIEILLVNQMFERVDNVLAAAEGHITLLGSEQVFSWEGVK